MAFTTLAFASGRASYPADQPIMVVTSADKSLYPKTDNGLTFGTIGGTSTNGVGGGASPTSGAVSITAGGTRIRLDMPKGRGRYRVSTAQRQIGAANSAIAVRIGAEDYSVIKDIGPASVPNGSVAEIDGSVKSAASWVAGAVNEILTLPASIYLSKLSSSCFISALAFEHIEDPLEDLIAQDFGDVGASYNGGVRPVKTQQHAQEPSGIAIAIIEVPLGAPTLTITGGSLQPYVTLEKVGNLIVVMTNGTRIPDGNAGTLIIRQNSGSLVRSTTFTWTILAAGSRTVNGTLLGLISTRAWLERKRVRDQVALCWPGHNGQAFTTDVTVATPAQFVAAVAAITPSGTSWHRIRLQNGVYNQQVYPKDINLGTGGLVIEPDNGHDPDFCCWWEWAARGVHLRGILCSATCDPGPVYNGWRFVDGGTFYNTAVIEKCRVGRLHLANQLESATGSDLNWYVWVNFEHGESVIIRDNVFFGARNGFYISSTYRKIRQRNDYRCMVGDFAAGILGEMTYSRAFRDGAGPYDAFMLMEDEVAHQARDFDGNRSGAHQDFWQERRFQQSRAAWYDSRRYVPGLTGGSSRAWIVGDEMYAPNTNLYKVKSIAANGSYASGIAAGTRAAPPARFLDSSDRSATFVDGGVTWEFVSINKWAGGTHYQNIEGCVLHDACYNPDSLPNYGAQFYINSNNDNDMPVVATVINCISATNNIRGIDNSGKGSVSIVEFCSWVYPARNTPLTENGYGNAESHNIGEKLYELKNVLSLEEAPATKGLTSRQKNKLVRFHPGGGLAQDPDTNLRGADNFVKYHTDNRWGYPDFLDKDLLPAEVRSSLSKLLHVNDGSAGARLREEHEVQVTGASGTDLIKLVITP